METQSDLLPISTVAEQLNTTPLNVLMHIKRGLLNGLEVNGAWYVPAAALEKYLLQAGGAAHGSLCKSSCKHSCSSCG